MSRCQRPFLIRFRAALILCTLLYGVLGGPAQAQFRVGDLAQDLCHSPPMQEDERDRFRRRGDFPRLLEALADDCPEVAMLFRQFEVGSIDGNEVPLSRDTQRLVLPLP